MNVIVKACSVAAVAWLGLVHPAAGVEELAAPLNAIADEVIVDENLPTDDIPLSPYDVVPYELDPAVERYYRPTPMQDDSMYNDTVYEVPSQDVMVQSPAFASESPWPSFGWPASLWLSRSTACCVQPRIYYWNHPLLATDTCPCDCGETVETHIPVPCQCCPVTVKVCVPRCCQGAPHCEAGRDLLGRKTYDYCWPCGYRIKIVDRHTGALVVHTFNR